MDFGYFSQSTTLRHSYSLIPTSPPFDVPYQLQQLVYRVLSIRRRTGPCLGFIFTFEFYGDQYARFMLYSIYIEKAKQNHGVHVYIGQLIRLIEFIMEETNFFPHGILMTKFR
jgi:hypothetical protein